MVITRDTYITAGLMLGLLAFAARQADAHPASGIAVDERGRVFFADTREGLWCVSADGATTLVKKVGLHWLTLDRTGAFAEASDEFNPFRRSTPRGEKPAVIECGGTPCTIGKDGNLYYPRENGLTIVRHTPRGEQSVLVSKEQFKRDWTHNMGVAGMACGPDGTIYVMGCDSFNKNEGVGEHVVWTVTMDGTIGKFAEGFVKEADWLPEAQRMAEVRPMFCRGIAVDGNGDVYVAVTGNRCVMRLTAKGKVSIVHRTAKPWTPTGVDVFRGEIYVLEYDEDTPVPHGDWPPQVKKVGRDGAVSTIAAIVREAR